MRNSSQRPGCIRRFPASHSCQARRVPCTNSAAPVCVKPTASRAARISAGNGLAEGDFPPLLLFGWFDIFGAAYPAVKVELQATIFKLPVRQFSLGLIPEVVHCPLNDTGISTLNTIVPLGFKSFKFGHRHYRPAKTGKFLSAYSFNGEPDVTVSFVGKTNLTTVKGDMANELDELTHFDLLAPVPEARLWRIHSLNSTRIACINNAGNPVFFEADTQPHNDRN